MKKKKEGKKMGPIMGGTGYAPSVKKKIVKGK